MEVRSTGELLLLVRLLLLLLLVCSLVLPFVLLFVLLLLLLLTLFPPLSRSGWGTTTPCVVARAPTSRAVLPPPRS